MFTVLGAISQNPFWACLIEYQVFALGSDAMIFRWWGTNFGQAYGSNRKWNSRPTKLPTAFSIFVFHSSNLLWSVLGIFWCQCWMNDFCHVSVLIDSFLSVPYQSSLVPLVVPWKDSILFSSSSLVRFKYDRSFTFFISSFSSSLLEQILDVHIANEDEKKYANRPI